MKRLEAGVRCVLLKLNFKVRDVKSGLDGRSFLYEPPSFQLGLIPGAAALSAPK